MYLAESYAETSAECSQSTHGSQESKKRTRKSSKVEFTHWRVFTNQIFFFWLPLNQQHTISDICSVCPNHMLKAHRHTGAWHGARNHTHDSFDCYATNERQLYEEKLHEETVLSKNLCRLLNKASHLTAFYTLYSSLHLPVTPAQLMRPGIGRNASCAVGDFA